jgi:hypothetical protein
MTEVYEQPEKQAQQSAEDAKAVERRLTDAKDVTPSDRYLDAARAGVAEHPDHVIKAQDRAGEQAAMQEITDRCGQAVDLNEHGANFPIYDVGSRDGIASVKVHLPENVDQAALNKQYAREFEEAIGRGGGGTEPILGKANDEHFSPAKFNNAARHLHEMAKSGAALPPELANSPAEAANYLREHGQLAIPSDHAEQLRSHLEQRLLSDDPVTRQVQAERLGLDMNSANYQSEVGKMLDRITALPITSDQLRSVTPRQLTA